MCERLKFTLALLSSKPVRNPLISRLEMSFSHMESINKRLMKLETCKIYLNYTFGLFNE